MTDTGSLEELLKAKEEEREKANQMMLQLVRKKFETFNNSLNDLFSHDLALIKSAIGNEAETLKKNARLLYKFSLLNPLLIGLTIFLSLALGTSSLSYYLSWRLRTQLLEIDTNSAEITHQEVRLQVLRRSIEEVGVVTIRENTIRRNPNGTVTALVDQ